MATDAQRRAASSYRKRSVKTFTLKFFPDDTAIWEHLSTQGNKSGYLKGLIRSDMERENEMSAKDYTFESKNAGDVTVTVVGDYVDGCKDITVDVEGTGAYQEFIEVDGGAVDEIFEWLFVQGVKFECLASLYYNVNYVASVMIDRDETPARLLARVDAMTQDQLRDWAAMKFPADDLA